METTNVENTIPVLPVNDIDRSIDYYISTLGFVLDWRGDVTASVSRNGHPIMLSSGTDTVSPSRVWIGLSDYSVFDEYRAKSVGVVQEPMNHTWAYEMKFEDIDGNVLWLGTEMRTDLPLDD